MIRRNKKERDSSIGLTIFSELNLLFVVKWRIEGVGIYMGENGMKEGHVENNAKNLMPFFTFACLYSSSCLHLREFKFYLVTPQECLSSWLYFSGVVYKFWTRPFLTLAVLLFFCVLVFVSSYFERFPEKSLVSVKLFGL